MASKQVISFLTIFSILYGIINFYIFIHGFTVLEDAIRTYYTLLFCLLATSFFIGRYLERRKLYSISKFFVWTGSLWFGAILYFFISAVLIDLVLLVNIVFKFLPDGTLFFQYVFAITVSIVILILFAGYINARNVRIKKLEIRIEGKKARPANYKIAAVSDIHLGAIIGVKRLKNIVKKINSLNPDIVLLPGDVVDEDIGPVINQNLGELLKKIRSKFGVYSVTGNHEYIGGVEEAVRYLKEHSTNVIRDGSVFIDNNFYVVGREDAAIRSFAGKERKPLKELIDKVDRSMPIILMDHQPYKLEEAVQNNIDLQLSGHTHHAQMWPLNFITKKIYEVSWGYKKKGNTHFYVSCGAGTWGPPVRIGNTPEIMDIALTIA